MVRYGVIGAGHLGRFHILQALEVDGCTFTGFYETNPDRATEIAEETGSEAYSDLTAFLKTVDAVSIVTPTPSHHEIAKAALHAGVHVLIEKPITVTVDEATELIDLANTHKLKIQVGHIERFNPAMRALNRSELNPVFIESHRLAPFHQRGSDVAVVLDLMIHDIDLILTLVDSEIREIKASGMPIISDTPDIANSRIEFENGCIANITASRISANRMRKMRIFQPNAYASIDFHEGTADVYALADPGQDAPEGEKPVMLGQIEKGSKPKEIRYSKYDREDRNPLRDEIISFVNAIESDSTPIVTGEDGRRALQVASEIIRQIESYQQTVLGGIT